MSRETTEDPWDICNVVRDYYLSLNKKETGYVHPGSADLTPTAVAGAQGTCPRFLGYKLIAEPPIVDFTPNLRRRFEVGEDRESRIGVALKDRFGDRVELDVPVKIPKIQLYGRADGVLDGTYGYDAKSVSLTKMHKIMVSETPYRSHVDQMLFYIHGLGLKSCTILYECNDSMFDPVALVVLPDPQRYHYLENYLLEKVLKPISNGVAPYAFPGGHCSRCRYRLSCKKGKFGDD